MTCEVCGGARFAKDTPGVRWKGKHVADPLTMEIGDAKDLVADALDIARTLRMLHHVGPDDLHLGPAVPNAFRERGPAGEPVARTGEAIG